MSSRKRGLSVEEKRSRLLDLFYEKKDFFLLKELEKMAPKEKGIVSQSVKDVVQSLVDDDLVDTDKIGTSVYFWSFPSKATAIRKRKLAEVEAKLAETAKRMKVVEEETEKQSEGKEDSEERQQALSRLSELQSKKEATLASIQKYRDCDPEMLKVLQEETKLAAEGSNRWTDNIYSLHSWIGNKFPSISVNDLNKQFGIPDDLDYVGNN